MWLILCNEQDAAALWAARLLGELGREEVEVLTERDLAAGVRWEHEVGDAGTTVRIDLTDGRGIDGKEVSGTLCRWAWAPPIHDGGLPPKDQEYAYQETAAFFLSWVSGLPGPKLNPPTPHGLGGRWRSDAEWHCLAARAGFATEALRIDSSEEAVPSAPGPVEAILVVGERVIMPTPLPDEVRRAAMGLSEVAQTPLLGIYLYLRAGEVPIFAGANPYPDLRPGGDEIITAIADAFAGLPVEAGS